ncbi:MAG: hypothetical protein QJR10_12655 [Bacillota bacterium]|nr:hypothetical protein [Bacillota bacterium]
MEIFFNLAWMALSMALLLLWLQGSRKRHPSCRLPSLRVQCVALGMLILVLLPVVSLSDDLQAMMVASEIEHTGRRTEILPMHDQPAEFALLLIQLQDLHTFPHQRILAWLRPVDAEARPLDGNLREMANRPPPASF